MSLITGGKFIPGLFNDCVICKTNKNKNKTNKIKNRN